MNKREVIAEVTRRSGIATEECVLVLNTFEEVVADELNHSDTKGGIFDTVYKVMSYLNRKREKKNK